MPQWLVDSLKDTPLTDEDVRLILEKVSKVQKQYEKDNQGFWCSKT